jgi:hypothetical protein
MTSGKHCRGQLPEKTVAPKKLFFMILANGGESDTWMSEQTNLMGMSGLQSVGSVSG